MESVQGEHAFAPKVCWAVKVDGDEHHHDTHIVGRYAGDETCNDNNVRLK